MIEKLKADLAKFQYVEKAVLTDEELEILRKMFSIEGSFHALFRHLCMLETDKGTQMIYDIEEVPSAGNYTDREIADLVRFKKMATQQIRGRMEALRVEFASNAQKELSEEEAKVKEEQEKIDKEREERAIEKKGISPEM